MRFPPIFFLIVLVVLLSAIIYSLQSRSLDSRISPDAIRVNTIVAPSINDNAADLKWNGANHYATIFNLTDSNGRAYSYDADVYLGHNDNVLFLGTVLHHVGFNPNDNAQGVYNDILQIYFDTDNDAKLTPPEDSRIVYLVVSTNPPGRVAFGGIDDGFWDGSYWSFDTATDYAVPCVGTIDVAGSSTSYVNTTGDEVFQLGIPLNSKDYCRDGLHLSHGFISEFGFALFYVRAGEDSFTLIGSWPNKVDSLRAVGPSDAAQYKKMAIDLRSTPFIGFTSQLLQTMYGQGFLVCASIQCRHSRFTNVKSRRQATTLSHAHQ